MIKKKWFTYVGVALAAAVVTVTASCKLPPIPSTADSSPSNQAETTTIEPIQLVTNDDVPMVTNDDVPTNAPKAEASSPDVANKASEPPTIETQGNSENIQEILEAAIASMGIPLNGVSAMLIDLQGDTYAQFNADEPHYPASFIKLLWSVEALRRHGPEPELIALIHTAIAPRDATDYASNTAANQILDMYLANGEMDNCEVRSANIDPIDSLPVQGTSVRKVHPYMLDGQLIESPIGCDAGYASNSMTVDDMAWLMKELAIDGSGLGLDRDIIRTAFLDPDAPASLFRIPSKENDYQWSVTKGFLSEWIPAETTTIASKVGYSSKGVVDGAFFVYHPEGKAVASWAIALTLPIDYEQAAPQFGATVHNLMTVQ